jgi:N-acetylmuramoyl-L-alanine amidase
MMIRNKILVLICILFPIIIPAQVTGLQGWNIFVDPGHSQNENMPPFSWGISEAKRNVRVALQLRDILLSETDIDTVYLSRTNDQQYVTLSQRTDLANSLNAAWYHSVHSDASGSPGANSTLLLWGQYANGLEKIPNGGKAMSDIMINYLTDGMRTYTINGSIGDCSFYGCTSGGPYLHVNRETIMPSELSEAGFHTNYRQNQLFMNSNWLRLEARTFYWSILDFHQIQRPPVNILTGIVTNLETEQPLNGAVITAENRQDTTDTFQSLFHLYTSDPDLLHNGFFYFENMDFDSVTVTVEVEDYYPDTVRIAIRDDFFTFLDFELISQIPPYLVNSIPEDGDSAVSILDDIVLEFSRPMSVSSVQSLLAFTPNIPCSYHWSENYTKLAIRSDSLQFLTTYTISIPGTITDQYNHLFDGNADGIGGDSLEIIFTTGIDIYPPQIVSFYPRLYQRNVELRPIVSVEFDEELADSTVTPERFVLERYDTHDTIPGLLRHYVVDERSVINFFPAGTLTANKIHVIRVRPGLQDRLGNTITTTWSASFTTALYDCPKTVIDALEPGFSSYWMQPGWSGSTTGTNPVPGVYREESQEVVNELTGSTRSLKLFYDWDLNASAWLIREYLNVSPPRNVLFDSTYILQCYVFGDGSSTQFRFCVDDHAPIDGVAQYHEVSNWLTIDWIGWRLVQWNLGDPGSVGTWLGDGVLDSLLRIDSFQLTYQSGASPSGILYFDDLQLLTDIPVNIAEQPQIAKTIPTEFALEQNFPNPFNPLTSISYSLPMRVQVKIIVYNTLGQVVKILLSEEKPAGHYQLQFDASDLASGLYIYQIQAGDFVRSRKMMLIK